MTLYGKALAKQVPAATTGNQARAMFGLMTASLANAYGTLSSYGPSTTTEVLAPALALAYQAIDADSVKAAQDYLDSTNAMLAGYYADMPESDDVLTAQQLQELKTAVSTSSVACKTVDDLFSTGWLEELSAAIVEAIGTVAAQVAKAVSTVAGSFIGGTWWIWILVAGVLVFYARFKEGRL